MKSKRRIFLALLAISGVFYAVDCLVVVTLGKHPDVPWYESGIYAGGPFGFLVTGFLFVFAFGFLLFGRGR